MRHHIHTVLSHFQSRVYCWDVVNEAVADSGEAMLRESPWLDQVGDDYVAQAFWYAHEADPKAQLFYNDYNETDPVKCEKICQLVKGLVEQGVPIHGIGLQGHFKLNAIRLDEVRRAFDRYASLGLRLQVTELDISLYDWGDRRRDLTEPDQDRLEIQAERYQQLFQIFQDYASMLDSVTFWGVADDSTWLDDFPVRGRLDWPLLFDRKQQPKPAFRRLMTDANEARP
jgi:endo-1,4-beta-xylanase